jgi:hypothetical protein
MLRRAVAEINTFLAARASMAAQERTRISQISQIEKSQHNHTDYADLFFMEQPKKIGEIRVTVLPLLSGAGKSMSGSGRTAGSFLE